MILPFDTGIFSNGLCCGVECVLAPPMAQMCCHSKSEYSMLPLRSLMLRMLLRFRLWIWVFSQKALRSEVCCGTDVLPLKAGFQHIWDLSLIRQHSPLSRDAEVNDLFEHNIWIVSVGSETSTFQYNFTDYVSLCGPYRILPSI